MHMLSNYLHMHKVPLVKIPDLRSRTLRPFCDRMSVGSVVRVSTAAHTDRSVFITSSADVGGKNQFLIRNG